MRTASIPAFRLLIVAALVGTGIAGYQTSAVASVHGVAESVAQSVAQSVTQSVTQSRAVHRDPTVTAATVHGRSAALRTLSSSGPSGSGHPALTLPAAAASTRPPTSPAKHAQVTTEAPTGKAFSAPEQNFEGIGHSISGFKGGGTPPDPNSDVSATQIVEIVNTSVAVFSKTGTLLHGPVDTVSLFSSLGTNPCASRNDGDGVVRYDSLAHRWFIAQFAIPTDDGLSGPDYECVAVSTSDDATGSYYVYAFPDQFNGFPDYGKFGVWPDGYYATFNDFSGDESSFLGGVSCVYDRAKMLTGAAATQQCFNLGSSYFGILPADLDGPTPPPAGAPNYQLALTGYNSGSSLSAWLFHVDWTTPANTTLTHTSDIPVASYDGACNTASENQCIPEPAGGHLLDSLGDRLMFPLTYRNFGADGVLTVSHTITTGSTTGERWYQIAVSPGNQLSLAQQGTYTPSDGLYRFMGSITSDRANDLALGFSTSNSTSYPGMGFTGRLATDPSGTMTQAEQNIFEGTGYETTYGRWGDYSSMDVDPADDCTFWYTNEYYTPGATYTQWNTRIASFVNPGCTSGDFGLSLTSGSGTTSSGQAATTIDTATTAGDPGTIALSVSGLPTGATASFDTASVKAGGNATLTVNPGTAPTGTYPLVVTAQSPSARHSVEYDVTITDDFTIGVTPSSGAATAPGVLHTTVSTAAVSGNPGSVTLSTSGVPTGATATLGTTSVAAGDSTTLDIDPGTAAAGDYPITVTATGSGDVPTHQATYELSIEPAFTISLDTTSGTAYNSSTLGSTVHTTAGFGGPAPLTLSVSGLPAGATAGLSATSIAAGGTSTLSIHPGTAADGTYPITVTAHNSAGSGTDESAVYTLVVHRDTVAPLVSMHPLSPATLDPSAILGWSGSDTISGVASYQLRYRAAAATGHYGAWVMPTSWQNLTTTTATTAGLAQGSTRCVSVRATDHAGNVSAWSPATCTTRAIDDRALSPSAHWKRAKGASYWNGTATTTSTKGAVLSFAHAHASRLGLVASTCSTCGKVAIYVGAHKVGTLNLKGTKASRKILLLPVFSARAGTVKIKVLTSKLSVVIDGLVDAQ